MANNKNDFICAAAIKKVAAIKEIHEKLRKKQEFANDNYICPNCGGGIYKKSFWFKNARLQCRLCDFWCYEQISSDGMA